MAIGENTAENIKIEIGAALTNPNKLTTKIRGRDLITGLPRDLIINSNEIVEAIDSYLDDIVTSVQSVFNVTPPELVADIMEKGIIVSGGTAQLRHIDEFFRRHLGVAAYVAEDPFYCVAKGTAVILEHLDVYKRTLLSKL